ncbi:MAG: hypothetical protein KKG33_14430 [candidate division Zixibacteria bacterium]|nr:hypothetical protein [candidate division Zixibacteria bacterium]MBU1469258.1 hypothetical protein [candidate division Zixibacteria bacterium]MBU2626749.1 hypothetical protein [candidate division Zixibacteria bacterium]
MRKSQIMILMLSMFALLAVSAFAGEVKKESAEKKPIELHAQTLCPVMGGKVDSTAYTDIQGQRVYHCCPACSKTLKSDPDKYFKKAAAEGVLFENVQATCPVSGKELGEKSVFTDYEGRRVYFCCEKCPVEFAKDPQKCLAKLDQPVETEKASKAEKTQSHEGHDH